jgi:hypothetical protein
MEIRILDLDGSIPLQRALMDRCRPGVVAAQEWGPRIRMGCSFRRFRRFQRDLATLLGDPTPAVILYGSGDFHHVSLALLARLNSPFNLLVLDNHPDWMRRVPLLHCGTWLYHAAQLPHLQRVFHVGGDVDFDNWYRWLAPWKLLQSGRITVLPAVRRFAIGKWSAIANTPIRHEPHTAASTERIAELVRPFREELARCPLYISVDKDAMQQRDAVVNWDSGHLTLEEACTVVSTFVRAAEGQLAGMDLLGDWSAVRLQGLLRRAFHLTEHPPLTIDPESAARCNEQTNLALLRAAGVVENR